MEVNMNLLLKVIYKKEIFLKRTAGRLVASAAVARLHADKRFLKLMKKARKEYRKLTR